jgi:hypothetical protein
VGIRLIRTDTGERHEVRTTADADDYEATHPGPWKRERTPVPPRRIPGIISSAPVAPHSPGTRRTLATRTQKAGRAPFEYPTTSRGPCCYLWHLQQIHVPVALS